MHGQVRLNNNLPVEIENRLIAGATRFAAHEKSDPFALSRAMSHIRNGIVGDLDANGNTVGYEAEVYYETMEYKSPIDGKTHEFKLERWRNGKRP